MLRRGKRDLKSNANDPVRLIKWHDTANWLLEQVDG